MLRPDCICNFARICPNYPSDSFPKYQFREYPVWRFIVSLNPRKTFEIRPEITDGLIQRNVLRHRDIWGFRTLRCKHRCKKHQLYTLYRVACNVYMHYALHCASERASYACWILILIAFQAIKEREENEQCLLMQRQINTCYSANARIMSLIRFMLRALRRLHIEKTSVHSRQNHASILVNLMGPLTVLGKIYVNML